MILGCQLSHHCTHGIFISFVSLFNYQPYKLFMEFLCFWCHITCCAVNSRGEAAFFYLTYQLSKHEYCIRLSWLTFYTLWTSFCGLCYHKTWKRLYILVNMTVDNLFSKCKLCDYIMLYLNFVSISDNVLYYKQH